MKRKITISARVGAPIMKVLASGKRLRGTVLDPFGRTQMRKLERELLDIFETSIYTVLARVAEGTMTVDEATDIASLPQAVRGYEALKIERAGIYRQARHCTGLTDADSHHQVTSTSGLRLSTAATAITAATNATAGPTQRTEPPPMSAAMTGPIATEIPITSDIDPMP